MNAQEFGTQNSTMETGNNMDKYLKMFEPSMKKWLAEHEKGSGRAIIALARKITRIVFVMLSKREKFKPDLMFCVDNMQQTA